MNQNLIMKKCLKCNALVEVLEDCHCEDCGITCCGEPMQEVTINDKDASFEKHIPTYEINGDKLLVKVNHGMDKEHYIEWISIRTEKETYTKKFTPEDTPELSYNLEGNATIYSYCNKHGLWKVEVRKESE